MAIITMWSSGKLEAAADETSICIRVSVPESVMEPGYIRISSEEAVKLRDELSRLITEQAQKHAQKVTA